MDSVLPPVISSIPQAPPTSKSGEMNVKWISFYRTLLWAGRGIGLGIFITFLIALALMYLPYDRVVIEDQPETPSIMAKSIRLQQNSFVVLYMKTAEGIQYAGDRFLQKGYYRNVVIPIDFSLLADYKGRSFVVRIAKDTDNDVIFNEPQDPFVTTRDGKVYQKIFHFQHPQVILKEFWFNFLDHPFSTFIDMVLP